jgi:thiol-disulfide isomerase/thioredoxin
MKKALPSLWGIPFLFLAVYLFNHIDDWELSLYRSTPLTLRMVFIYSRLCVGLAFFAGLQLLVQAKTKILVTLITGLVLLTAFSSISALIHHFTPALADPKVKYVWISSTLVPLALTALALLNKRSKFKRWYTHAGWLLPCLLWPFIFYPMDLYPALEPPHRAYNEVNFKSFQEDSLKLSDENHLILFASTNCPYCRRLMHKLSSFAAKNNLPRATVLLVSYDEGSPEAWQNFYKFIGSYAWPRQPIAAKKLYGITQNRIPLLLALKNDTVMRAYTFASFDDAAITELLTPD